MKRNNSSIFFEFQKLLMVSGLSLFTLQLPAHAELVISSGAEPVATASQVSKSITSSVNKKQAPSDESLIKLLEVTRMAEMMQSMAGSQNDMMESIIQSTLKQEDLEQMTEQQRQQLTQVLTQYTQQMLAGTNEATVEIAQKYFVTVAKNHYTQAEVDAQIAFYSTEVGQSILDKQPKLIQEYTRVLLPEVIQIANATHDKLAPQLEKDLEAIFK